MFLYNSGFNIISDTQMTQAAENLWFSLAKKNLVKIINIETMKIYKLEEINNKNVIDPKNDIHPEMFSDNYPNGQKWFYLLSKSMQ